MDGSVSVNGHANRCPSRGDAADPRCCLSCARLVEVHGHRNQTWVWCAPSTPDRGVPVGLTAV